MILPDLADGAKCGLDDFFASGKTREALVPLIVERLPGSRAKTPAAMPIYRSMNDVEARAVEWLWNGYIIKHKVNLVAGMGGVGKGQMICDIVARLSRGDAMPDGEHRASARTLILAAEDDPNEDLRPRLDANSANHDHIFIMDGIATETDGVVAWVDVRKHAAQIKHVIEKENIDLLYIDPISSYMPGTDRNSQGGVRDALSNVQRLINETGVTVLATVHLGKTSERRGQQRILGSVEFVNLARNVLAINDLPDEHQPDDVLDDPKLGRRKVLQVVKSNSGIAGPPLSFSRPLDAAVAWHGVAPVGFDESFAISEPKSKLKQDVKEWLWEYLKGGMKPASEVQDAVSEGVSDSTLRRAREELGVISERVRFQGPYYWRLPHTPQHDGEVSSPRMSDNDAKKPDNLDELGADADNLGDSLACLPGKPDELGAESLDCQVSDTPEQPRGEEPEPPRLSRLSGFSVPGADNLGVVASPCTDCGVPTTNIYRCDDCIARAQEAAS